LFQGDASGLDPRGTFCHVPLVPGRRTTWTVQPSGYASGHQDRDRLQRLHVGPRLRSTIQGESELFTSIYFKPGPKQSLSKLQHPDENNIIITTHTCNVYYFSLSPSPWTGNGAASVWYFFAMTRQKVYIVCFRRISS